MPEPPWQKVTGAVNLLDMDMRGGLRVRSSGGVSIEVHDLGGHGEPLLICHAVGFCGRAYEPLASELSELFHVWAMDFRGHGLSDVPADGDFSWDRMSEDARAAVLAIAPEGVKVFGHSMGGAAALLAEARWPGTVTAAYVYEPAIVQAAVPAELERMMVERTRRRSAAFASREEARVYLAARPPYSSWRGDCLDAFVEHGFADRPDGSVELRCTAEHEALCYASPTSSIADVADVRIPLAVALGLGPDIFNATPAARALSAAIPPARLVEHAELSHFGPFEDPVAVAKAARTALI
ncbi:alpha/beta fold hydrolase [Sporichthya polymorpha]|uniref:alpha/beta fold hydrolase n=1 Tax=Sporichthya polymorpha TaxID=35751 RepID=UPI0003716B36|nr:alpha/beta hydrolase [Sporichthya polymorpha]